MQLQPQPNNQPKKRRGLASLIFTTILLGAGLLLWLNRQYAIDTVSFWQYQPSAAVADIATRSDLTDTGKFLFYASQPVVDGSRAFSARCDQKEQGTAILGCYTADRIYIYDVTNAKLDGIKEVTAAHEMLHAVYQRLSDSERATVDKLVEAEYTKLSSNADYAERMAFYARTEPGARDNELHSIIGTEVASISPELEAHYQKYFTDRSKVVGYYTAYSGVFASLSQQAKDLSAQLDALNQKIKQASASYNNDVKQLNADIATFNDRAARGDFSSQTQFTAQRQALINRSNNLSAERTSANDLITQYNKLKDTYNDTVTQSNELYKSIDSNLAPAPKV